MTGRTPTNRGPAHRRRAADRTGRSHSVRGVSAAVAALIILVAVVLVSGNRSAASSTTGCTLGAPPAQLAGCQGQNTELPATASVKVVKEPNAGSAFPNLTVTVNQTQDLVNQDVSLSWTGGTATTGPDVD